MACDDAQSLSRRRRLGLVFGVRAIALSLLVALFDSDEEVPKERASRVLV
jgi:hypothetical protein